MPIDKYIVFYGKPKEGEFIVEDINVVENPKNKADDYEGDYEFYYDGKNKSNCIWEITEVASENSAIISGEIAYWNDYLDWKRRLAEMRIKGIKYIAVRADLDKRQISFLTASPSKEDFDSYRKTLFKNEMSVFSNNYSVNRWNFEFNYEMKESNNSENGVALQFIDIGKQFSFNSDENLGSWDEHRDYCKKDNNNEQRGNMSFFSRELRRDFPNAYLVELIFDISFNGSMYLERANKRNSSITEDMFQTILDEFYGEGFIATSQIGDFALINRLKIAIRELTNGKSISQNLNDWLFNITAARLPKHVDHINTWQNKDINEEQKRAVEKILSAEDVCLVQGPPGTGKTTVIAEAIYQFVIRKKRVLVTSQANLAVDNALERLISNPNVRAIRLGNNRKIASSVNNITEQNVLETFYNSILEFVDKEYLDVWDSIKKKEAQYSEEYESVKTISYKACEIDQQLELEQNKLVELVEEYNALTNDNDAQYEIINRHNAERVNLKALRICCNGTVENNEFSLFKDSIVGIYSVIKEELEKLKSIGIIFAKVTIDIDRINMPSKQKAANDVFHRILDGVFSIRKLEERLNNNYEEEVITELEEMKLRENILKEQMIKDGSIRVFEEWRKLQEKIQKLSTKFGSEGLSEKEWSFFDDFVAIQWETDENKYEYLKHILAKADPLIDSLLAAFIAGVENILLQYNKDELNFELKAIELEKIMEEQEKKVSELQNKREKYEVIISQVCKKYDTSLEHIGEKLKEMIRLLDSKQDNKIRKEKWENIFRGLHDWVDGIPDYTQENEMYLTSFINGCNVVGVSCTENNRTLTEKGFDDFDVVIIDEVSKATPPELLIPLIKGRKAVLVGDHRQLPPLFNEHEKSYGEMVDMQEEMEEQADVILSRDDFEKYKDMVTASLFQKYFENADNSIKHSLLVQYRMHSDIMDIVNMFYDGKLKDGACNPNDTSHKSHGLTVESISGTEMIIPERHAYWFDSSLLRGNRVLEQRKQGSTSTENILECHMIMELLKKVEIHYANSNRETPVSIGVISFYFDQVKLIKKLMKEQSFHAIDVEVNTVDRFQGKEKEIIFVSLVRNVKSERRSIDSHIAAFERINVAFSRAQNLLVIVGANDMYANQPVKLTDMDNGEKKESYVYKDIIEMLDMRGTYFNSDDLIQDILADEILMDGYRRAGVNR